MAERIDADAYARSMILCLDLTLLDERVVVDVHKFLHAYVSM